MVSRSVRNSHRPSPTRPATKTNTRPRSAAWPIYHEFDAAGVADRNLYAVVLIDMAGSARAPVRLRTRLRRDLYDLVEGALHRRDLALESFDVTDTGDGLRLLLPLVRISPADVLDTFVLGLVAGLRQHRQYVAEESRIRLRVAFDVGEVERHLGGWTGEPLVRVARLVDSDPVRGILLAHPGLNLAAIASDFMYRSFIEPGDGYIASDCFQSIQVRVKEFDAQAWLLTRYASWPCGSCDEAAA